MRILIFSDSLGRPRPNINESEKTEYEEVYGYLLKKYFKDDEVEIIYIESLDSRDAIHWSERMIAFKRPDLVVIHLGINDCSPRIFSKNSRSIVFNSFFRKLTNDIILKFIGKFRKQIIKYIVRNKVYVGSIEFEQNILKICSDIKLYNSKCNFIGIGIAYRRAFLENRSPGGACNIDIYNRIIKKIFGKNYIDINRILGLNPENNLISDGIHLTRESHKALFEAVKDQIKRIKSCAE